MSPYGPLPIIVGVTGHRDLRPEDTPHLEAVVRRVFEKLRRKYPHSELLVVSPLAEGADRLVARVAVDAGIRLVVPMPLELDDYSKDFASAASVAEFDTLLAAADRHFVAPHGDDDALVRPQCYARVGAYVAKHCHILLALWDGQTPHHIGGTAEVVRHRREGMQSESRAFVRLLDATDTGVVYHIVTPRQSNPATHGAPYSLRVLPPSRHRSAREAEAAIHRICESTDGFNAIGATADARTAARREQRAEYLLSNHPRAALPDGLQRIRALYAYADDAALMFQRRTQWTIRGLFWLAFGFVFAFEVFAHGTELVSEAAEQPLLILYMALFGVGYLVHRWATAREIDTRHLDYRALAEGLRVEFYWRLGEVRSVAADYCMRYRLEELEWIRLALRSCELQSPSFTWTATPAASVEALCAVANDWVQGQHEYFGRTVRKQERHLKKLERWTKVLLGVGLIAVVAVFIATFRHQLERVYHLEELPERVHALIVATIGLAPAAAGLIHGYAEQRALSVHIRRYARMRLLFAAAMRVLDVPMKREEWAAARDVLAELGREALEENADWVMLHRERPIELPGA